MKTNIYIFSISLFFKSNMYLDNVILKLPKTMTKNEKSFV